MENKNQSVLDLLQLQVEFYKKNSCKEFVLELRLNGEEGKFCLPLQQAIDEAISTYFPKLGIRCWNNKIHCCFHAESKSNMFFALLFCCFLKEDTNADIYY
jgi:hypothetical protein